MQIHETSAAKPPWLLCPLQHPQDNSAALCMAAWQDSRACTFGACVVYRKLAGLLNVRDILLRRVAELETAIAAEKAEKRKAETNEQRA